MLGISAIKLLPWVDMGYFLSLIFAAIFTVTSIIAGLFQYRLNADINRDKDRQLVVYQDDTKRAVAKAQSDAGTANDRAAQLTKEAADAQERAAQIMKATAWRQFTPEQMKILESDLSKGTGKMMLAWISGDPESLSLAIQFSQIFQSFPKGAWNIAPSAKIFPDNLVWDIRIPDAGAASTSVEFIRNAFRHAGVAFSTDPLPPEVMSFGSGAPVADQAVLLFGSKKPTFAQPVN